MIEEPHDAANQGNLLEQFESVLSVNWRQLIGFSFVSTFNIILLFSGHISLWSSMSLCDFGLVMSFLWTFSNWPSMPFLNRYANSSYATRGADMAVEFLPHRGRLFLYVLVSMILGMFFALLSMFCFIWFVMFHCFDSIQSFLSFGLALVLLAATWKIYPMALASESSAFLECDHILRLVGIQSQSKGKVYEIVCLKCHRPYYTPEPLFTQGMCKECYGVQRFKANWWAGICVVGIFVWSLALRDLTESLVSELWQKILIWIALYFLSGILWFPLMKGRWYMLITVFFPSAWPKLDESKWIDMSVPPPAPPRLITDANRRDDTAS
jgi:hypothetical protein